MASFNVAGSRKLGGEKTDAAYADGPRGGRPAYPRNWQLVGRAKTLLVHRHGSVPNDASPYDQTVGIHSDAGPDSKRHPFAMLRGLGSGDGFCRRPFLCGVSSVCRRRINVNTLVHCFLLATP